MIIRCCFCNKIIGKYGNNPYPASKDPNAVCCDACNMSVVIPTRLQALKENS